MRSTRLIAFTLVLFVVSAVSYSQVNWTPKPQPTKESSGLSGISVGMIALSPEEARAQYNIEISKQQEFVIVQGVESESRAARSDIAVGDLVDTIILGGEVPHHGEVKDLADFNHFVSLCVPTCLVLVRQKGQTMSNLNSLGPIETKFIISEGATPSWTRANKHNPGGIPPGTVNLEKIGYYRNNWQGLCDKQTKYFYYKHLPAYVDATVNWLSPDEFKKTYGVKKSCENYGAPDYQGPSTPIQVTSIPQSQVSSIPQSLDSVQREIEQIRNAPHEAMPAAQATRASLGGQTSMTVENGTSYVLYLYLSGPINQTLQIAAGSSQTLYVSPGYYEIAAKVSDPSVIPFYGRDTYSANTQYSHHFYISTQQK